MASRTQTIQLPGRKYDHWFFVGMILLMMTAVAVGFAHTYYLAGLYRAPLASPLLHIHGAVFSLWMILLLLQAGLVSAHRVDLHRKLGIAGFALACCMVVLAVLAAAKQLTRLQTVREFDVLAFSSIPLFGAFSFAVLVGFAFACRKNPEWHKRLILIATMGPTTAAFGRWPFEYFRENIYHGYYASYVFLLMIVLYDLWALHKVSRATWMGGAFLAFVDQGARLLAPTEAWHTIARWIQGWGL
jgi:hypothetical protein